MAKDNTLLWLIGGAIVYYFYTQNQSVIPSNEPLNTTTPSVPAPPGGGSFYPTFDATIVSPGGVPPSSYAPPPSSVMTPSGPGVAPSSGQVSVAPVTIGQPVPVTTSTGSQVTTPVIVHTLETTPHIGGARFPTPLP